jgi:hypothetical protein
MPTPNHQTKNSFSTTQSLEEKKLIHEFENYITSVVPT